ncbi:MAG: hypothetical protein WC915_03060 [archaeon]|jgi:uncharacterized protein (UPF0333 family)
MKGQISLDLIFILIVVLMFISSTVLLAETARNNQEEALLKNQLRIIGINYSSFITKAQAISDTSFIAKLKLDRINYQGKRYTPKLNFEDNLLTITIEDSNQSEKIYFSKDGLNVSQETDYLVVRNE